MANFHVWNDWCGNIVVHVAGRQFQLHTVQIWRWQVQSDKKQIPVIITTKHMVNFTKFEMQFHHNAPLIKNAYYNCETPILFQIFKQNLATLFLEMEKRKEKKRKNNNRCIICETPIFIQIFKQNLATLFLEMEKRKEKKKKKNNNRCIILIVIQ